jgi:hypothetical protein
MAVGISIPMLLSALLPPMAASPRILKVLTPMLDYFTYEQIIESKPINVRQEIQQNGKNYILAFQPHGVVSMVAICSAIAADEYFCGTIPTGVASAVLQIPILKHVMGIFFLINASKERLQQQLQTKQGCEGTVVLYVGGMAELFLSDATEETLYLNHRKGFIKLALQTGVDIVPVYLFGNTTVLSVMKTGWLADVSRKLQLSLTYFWGKWYLPIPRDEKVRTSVRMLNGWLLGCYCVCESRRLGLVGRSVGRSVDVVLPNESVKFFLYTLFAFGRGKKSHVRLLQLCRYPQYFYSNFDFEKLTPCTLFFLIVFPFFGLACCGPFGRVCGLFGKWLWTDGLLDPDYSNNLIIMIALVCIGSTVGCPSYRTSYTTRY